MKFEAGKLYSYPTSRSVYLDSRGINSIGSLQSDEPFIMLEYSKKESKWVKIYKVLTSKGIIGWIQIGYPENVKELIIE